MLFQLAHQHLLYALAHLHYTVHTLWGNYHNLQHGDPAKNSVTLDYHNYATWQIVIIMTMQS